MLLTVHASLCTTHYYVCCFIVVSFSCCLFSTVPKNGHNLCLRDVSRHDKCTSRTFSRVSRRLSLRFNFYLSGLRKARISPDNRSSIVSLTENHSGYVVRCGTIDWHASSSRAEANGRWMGTKRRSIYWIV